MVEAAFAWQCQLKLITSDAADVYAHGKIWFIWSWLALQGGQSACVCKEQLCKPMQSWPRLEPSSSSNPQVLDIIFQRVWLVLRGGDLGNCRPSQRALHLSRSDSAGTAQLWKCNSEGQRFVSFYALPQIFTLCRRCLFFSGSSAHVGGCWEGRCQWGHAANGDVQGFPPSWQVQYHQVSVSDLTMGFWWAPTRIRGSAEFHPIQSLLFMRLLRL